MGLGKRDLRERKSQDTKGLKGSTLKAIGRHCKVLNRDVAQGR